MMRLGLLAAAAASAPTNSTGGCSAAYSATPLSPSLGVVITDPVGLGCVERLKADASRHGLVLLKNFEGDHLALSHALGSTWERPDQSPGTPHEHIQRLANQAEYGSTPADQCGLFQNWHTHGLQLHTPYRFQIIRGIKSVPGMGTTFMPLGHLFRRQPARVQAAWRQAWLRIFNGVLKPLVYDHPHTGEPTMTMHTSDEWLVEAVYNPGTPLERSEPAGPLLETVAAALAEAKDLELHVDWEGGDVLIVDNLAVAHSAGTEVEDTDELRILDFTEVYDATTAPPALMREDRTELLSANGGAQAWHLDTGRRCVGVDQLNRRIAKEYYIDVMEVPVPPKAVQ